MAACIYSAQGEVGKDWGEDACKSGLDAIGPVYETPESTVVAFTMHVCPDCMAHGAYSDWYKAEYGMRPRWMTREECIEAWWAMPEIAGVRPS